MLFCDLSIGTSVIWSGVPCLNGVDISTGLHLGFVGDLVFLDTMGSDDPAYSGLDGRFILLYIPGDGSGNSVIPLQAIPSQQVSIVLNGQNCIFSFYDKDETGAQVAGDYLALTAPLTCAITSTGVASAAGGSSWIWNVVNGTIISGQGTSSIVFQPISGGTVIISVTASLVTGGVAQASANVLAYNPGAFSISAPEYVWAGQFGVTASALGGDAPLAWEAIGAVKLMSGSTNPSITVDIGQAGFGASLSLAVGGAQTSTWTFKIVPYTSTAQHTTAVLAPGSYEDFTLDLGWQYKILSLQSDNPACLRVYQTAAARTADTYRPVTLDPNVLPTNPAAIVLEALTVIGYLSIDPLPYQPTGTNGDSPRNKSAYCRIYNIGDSTASITATLIRTELQISASF
jgi:hypothetical protein